MSSSTTHSLAAYYIVESLEPDCMRYPSCIDHSSSTLIGLSDVSEAGVRMDEGTGTVLLKYDVCVPVARLVSALTERATTRSSASLRSAYAVMESPESLRRARG